jgi:hypothetical protein
MPATVQKTIVNGDQATIENARNISDAPRVTVRKLDILRTVAAALDWAGKVRIRAMVGWAGKASRQ